MGPAVWVPDWARGFGQSLYPAVIEIGSTVKNDLLDAGVFGPRGDQFADFTGGIDRATVFQFGFQVCVQAGG